jgi:trehalose-phosphatase
MKHLFDRWATLAKDLAARRLVLFLDYDGTLTPIASVPEKAVLSDGVRAALLKLMALRDCEVVIISGRSLQQIKKQVGIKGLTYVGNHGLEIEGPAMRFEAMVSLKTQQAMALIKQKVALELTDFPGMILEDKRLTLSMHYRLCPPRKGAAFLKRVRQIVRPFLKAQDVRVGAGKKVVEVRPPIVWDKGKAALWILNQQRKLFPAEIFSLAVGDDTTDEDTFAALRRQGVTVVVGRRGRSCAGYYLWDTDEVAALLDRILEVKKDRSDGHC